MAGWYFDKITPQSLPPVFIRAGAGAWSVMEPREMRLEMTVELVRRVRAGRLASWQARLRADRDFD